MEKIYLVFRSNGECSDFISTHRDFRVAELKAALLQVDPETKDYERYHVEEVQLQDDDTMLRDVAHLRMDRLREQYNLVAAAVEKLG